MKTIISSLLIIFTAFSCTGKKQTDAIKENGKLVFDSIVMEEKIKLFPDKPDSIPYATVKVNFTYPVSFHSEEVLQNLQSVFYDKVFGERYANAPDAGYVIDTYIENHTDTYRELSSEFNEMIAEFEDDEFPFYRFSYYNSISNKIEYKNSAIVSFSVHNEEYQGGAHGAYWEFNTSINLNTQTIVQETDLFKSDYKEPLTQIVREKLIEVMKEKTKDYEIETGADYREFFFDYNNTYPNNNFLMDDKGVHYTYNIYEIAAYASGMFEVFIPYSEINHLLKPGILEEFQIKGSNSIIK